jgi:cell division protein FtsB
MEILNKNQRNKAFWRVFVLFLSILALIVWIVFSMYTNYEENGVGVISKLRSDCQKKEQAYIAELQGLKNENRKLKSDMVELRKKDGTPNQELKILEARLRAKDDEILKLERDIARLNRELNRY